MLDYSILIPAHDEANVIARTLTPLRNVVGRSVFVVCNGCSDDTAARARAAAPNAIVVEIATAGKAAAINHALALLPPGSVIVMDADVEIELYMLDAVAAALGEPGIRAASPGVKMHLAGADDWVRDYYRVFSRHPYLREGVGGSGIYGLSATGRTELGHLPLVLSDDDYIRHFFPLDRQRRVDRDCNGRPVHASVRPPLRIGELIRSEARWRAGDAAVQSGTAFASGPFARARRSGSHARRIRTEDRIDARALLRYAIVKLAGRAMLVFNRLRRRSHIWHRDTSSRLSR